ncbi:hypothetical protein GS504_03330 [Rhodococcus hoagii]|nr:hypothetical protein [Prescottella equi]
MDTSEVHPAELAKSFAIDHRDAIDALAETGPSHPDVADWALHARAARQAVIDAVADPRTTDEERNQYLDQISQDRSYLQALPAWRHVDAEQVLHQAVDSARTALSLNTPAAAHGPAVSDFPAPPSAALQHRPATPDTSRRTNAQAGPDRGIGR